MDACNILGMMEICFQIWTIKEWTIKEWIKK